MGWSRKWSSQYWEIFFLILEMLHSFHFGTCASLTTKMALSMKDVIFGIKALSNEKSQIEFIITHQIKFLDVKSFCFTREDAYIKVLGRKQC